MFDKYETVVGLEVHAQLKTKSKIFAPDATTFGANPNSQTSYITLGHPGTLPFINRKVIDYAIKIGLATHCRIQKYNEFARKNYFYADLPKGYQLTQFSTPICQEGYLQIRVNDTPKKIRIHHIHLEEDAGKSTHDQDPHYSQIDLNRAGVPLVEIVSEPDIRSGEEAYQYFAEIRRLVQYLDICDGNMEEGSLRCDANVSVRLKGETKLGQRTEIKNLNSLRFLKKAIEYEAKRQIKLIESGGEVVMQTRSFDANKGTTFALRSKEMAHDYRYFPAPDITPIVITDEEIAQIKAKLPALPEELLARYTQQLGLSAYDANILIDDQAMATYFDELMQHTQNAKSAANWMTGPIKSWLNREQATMSDFPIPPKQIAGIILLIDEKKINFTIASQQLFPALLQQPTQKAAAMAQQLNLLIESDDAFLSNLVEEVLNRMPDKVKAYKNGKKGLIGLFMGEVMKASKGKADPKITKQLLQERLSSNN